MSVPQKLALVSLAIGGMMGLVVVAAAAAAGRQKLLPLWLGGTGWGVLTAGLLITDCLHTTGPGPVSEAAFPIFFGGLAAWPAVLAWRQPHWLLCWLLAQMILLLCIGPAFAAAVIAAMCTLT